MAFLIIPDLLALRPVMSLLALRPVHQLEYFRLSHKLVSIYCPRLWALKGRKRANALSKMQ